MSIWENKLDHLIGTRQLVDIWRDTTDRDDEIKGVIAQRSTDFVVIQEVNDSAEYDWIEVIRLEDITRLVWDTRELSSIQHLMTSGATIVDDLPALDLTSTTGMLVSVMDAYGYVGLQLEDISGGYIIGEIEEMDTDYAVLNCFASKSSMQRYSSMIKLDSITRVEAGGKYERRLISLYRDNQAE